MKYTCTAFFYVDDDNKSCHVEIPEILIDFDVITETGERVDMIAEAQRQYEDVLFALSLSEGGIEIAGLADATSAYDFREELTADLDELKAHRTVIWEMKFNDKSQ